MVDPFFYLVILGMGMGIPRERSELRSTGFDSVVVGLGSDRGENLTSSILEGQNRKDRVRLGWNGFGVGTKKAPSGKGWGRVLT